MTNDNDAPRDAVAEARALLARIDGEPYGYTQHVTTLGHVYDLLDLTRALADECDALRRRVAALEAEQAERETIIHPYTGSPAFDAADMALTIQQLAKRLLDALARKELTP